VSPEANALLGLATIVGVLAGALTFALLRAATRARMTSRRLRQGGDNALLSTVLEEAVAKLKDQERATAARAEASERLSGEIIASLTAGLIVIDVRGDVRILNPAARRMLRISESSGHDDYHSLLGEPALSDVIDECLASRAPVVRRTVRPVDGRHGLSHLGVTVSPLLDPDGDLHGAICLFTDLTAVKQLEEQLRLKESLAAVGELTAGIAHEFRNGLATIHGYSRLLEPDALPASYRPYLQGIRAETELLGQVVTNFLNFARPAELTLSRVDLRAVCDRVATEMRAEAEALGGSVTVRGEFGAIDGDEVLLRQAFSNLVRNAFEACAGASVAPAVVIESTVDHSARLSRVTVDDNGPGINPDARDQVFRPFFTTKGHGTGLGLALVQKIIVFHNGRVDIGSSPLGGASLQVTLPIVS
jgi:signal transduction histidine kinase